MFLFPLLPFYISAASDLEGGGAVRGHSLTLSSCPTFRRPKAQVVGDLGAGHSSQGPTYSR